jgi:surface antigen
MLLAAAAAVAIGAGTAFAQPPAGPGPSGPDPDGYYSQTDRDGYYDRDGNYHHFRDDRTSPDTDRAPPDADRAYPDSDEDAGPPPRYYREGDYERACHSGDTAGTVFGAAGGGLIGGVASHGNPAAIVGGIILGGLFGHAVTHDIDCDDQRYAFDSYATGLNGEIGHRYEWRHGDNYGYFTPTKEYTEDGMRCREFHSVTFHHGEESDHDGAACYGHDGNWHFED